MWGIDLPSITVSKSSHNFREVIMTKKFFFLKKENFFFYFRKNE